MNISTTVKSERIDLRTNTEVKTIIERAAQLRYTTISAYLLDSALQKAKEDIRNTATLNLTEIDQDSFFSALDNRSEPNEALRTLLRETKRGNA